MRNADQMTIGKTHPRLRLEFSVLNSMMEQVKQENESDHSDVLPENSVPVIISGLRDQCVKLASPFSLSVTVENADTVTWMLEQQVIEAEPEEGLVLRQSGKYLKIKDGIYSSSIPIEISEP